MLTKGCVESWLNNFFNVTYFYYVPFFCQLHQLKQIKIYHYPTSHLSIIFSVSYEPENKDKLNIPVILHTFNPLRRHSPQPSRSNEFSLWCPDLKPYLTRSVSELNGFVSNKLIKPAGDTTVTTENGLFVYYRYSSFLVYGPKYGYWTGRLAATSTGTDR